MLPVFGEKYDASRRRQIELLDSAAQLIAVYGNENYGKKFRINMSHKTQERQ